MNRWTLLALVAFLAGLASLVAGGVIIIEAKSTLAEAFLALESSGDVPREELVDILALYMPFFSARMATASILLAIGIGLFGLGFAVYVFDLNNWFSSNLALALANSFGIVVKRLGSIDSRLNQLQRNSAQSKKRKTQVHTGK
jgi:hypothetical protein